MLKKTDPINLLFGAGLVVVGIYTLIPIFFVVLNAFNSAAYNVFPPEGFSLKWFESALSEPLFLSALTTSLVVGIGAMTLAVITGTMASFGLVRYRFKGQTLIKSILFAPILIPSIALGAALFLYYLQIGLYGGRLGLILAHSLLGLPFVISIMTAVILGIDPSLEEAAADLGAPPLSVFFKITLPQIRTGLVVSGLFSFMLSFDELDSSLFLVRPSNNTLPIEMFLYGQDHQNPTLSALSTLMIFITVVVVLVLIPLLKRLGARELIFK